MNILQMALCFGKVMVRALCSCFIVRAGEQQLHFRSFRSSRWQKQYSTKFKKKSFLFVWVCIQHWSWPLIHTDLEKEVGSQLLCEITMTTNTKFRHTHTHIHRAMYIHICQYVPRRNAYSTWPYELWLPGWPNRDTDCHHAPPPALVDKEGWWKSHALHVSSSLHQHDNRTSWGHVIITLTVIWLNMPSVLRDPGDRTCCPNNQNTVHGNAKQAASPHIKHWHFTSKQLCTVIQILQDYVTWKTKLLFACWNLLVLFI